MYKNNPNNANETNSQNRVFVEYLMTFCCVIFVGAIATATAITAATLLLPSLLLYCRYYSSTVSLSFPAFNPSAFIW